MDQTQAQALATVVGAVLPFIMALLKRFFPMSKVPSYAVAFGLSVAGASLVELYTNGFDIKKLIANIGYVFGVSQAVYAIVKATGTDERIEGNN